MNLSLHHLFAACRFASRIGEVERANAGEPFGPFWDEILHNALGVATLTVAALESYVNELYFEGNAIASALNPATAEELQELTDMKPMLSKYSLVLAVRSRRRLHRGNSVVQNVNALISLRDAVVHYRSEWFGEQIKHERLSKHLQYRFSPSPFLPPEPLFPMAWASHGFAVWALKSTVDFVDYFHSEAGMPSPLEQFRANLKTLSDNAL